MSVVERLDEFKVRAKAARKRAEQKWPTSHDVHDQADAVDALVAALRAVLAALDEYTDTVGVIFADDIRLVIDAGLEVMVKP